MISPRQRHPYRHFSLSAISPCIIRNQTDIDRFVGLSYLAVQCIFPRYLINQTGSTIQRDNRTAFNDYFFGVNRISAGISTLSILCPPSISILPNNIPTGHVLPLPGYGFLRPTDLLPAILQAYPSPIPHSPLSSRCGLPQRMYSLSKFLAPVHHYLQSCFLAPVRNTEEQRECFLF